MDSCTWTILNIKQNLLKTKQNTQKTSGTLITTRTGIYTYTFPKEMNIIY